MPFSIDNCPVRGNRVLAKRFIKRGELRIRMDEGTLIPLAQMQDDYYALQISETHFIGTQQPDFDDATCFLNHSCEPNLAFLGGEAVLTNIKDIAVGEELTWDYSTSIDDGAFAMPCNCQSPNCRRVITSFGELGDRHKARLTPYSLAYLQRRYGW